MGLCGGPRAGGRLEGRGLRPALRSRRPHERGTVASVRLHARSETKGPRIVPAAGGPRGVRDIGARRSAASGGAFRLQ